MATILSSEQGSAFHDALLRTVRLLAKEVLPSSGTSYTRIGEALRYYPLALILYTTAICGVAAKRGDLLKLIFGIPLASPERNRASPITELFFTLHNAGPFFNDAFGQRLCEPIAQRIRQVCSEQMSEMLTEFSESESFFRGEFVLALANIDTAITTAHPGDPLPAPGLYVYLHEAHEPVVSLLLESPAWLQEIYTQPLPVLLEHFDQNVHRMIDPLCMGGGFPKVSALYK